MLMFYTYDLLLRIDWTFLSDETEVDVVFDKFTMQYIKWLILLFLVVVLNHLTHIPRGLGLRFGGVPVYKKNIIISFKK